MWSQIFSNLMTRTEAILITRVANVRAAFIGRKKITVMFFSLLLHAGETKQHFGIRYEKLKHFPAFCSIYAVYLNECAT